MGRHVNPRSGDYDHDATVILRIAKAVAIDTSVTSEWRERVEAQLKRVASELLKPAHVPTSMGRIGRGKSGT